MQLELATDECLAIVNALYLVLVLRDTKAVRMSMADTIKLKDLHDRIRSEMEAANAA